MLDQMKPEYKGNKGIKPCYRIFGSVAYLLGATMQENNTEQVETTTTTTTTTTTGSPESEGTSDDSGDKE